MDHVEWLKNGKPIINDPRYSMYQKITDFFKIIYENRLYSLALKFGDKVTCKVVDRYGNSDSKDFHFREFLVYIALVNVNQSVL